MAKFKILTNQPLSNINCLPAASVRWNFTWGGWIISNIRPTETKCFEKKMKGIKQHFLMKHKINELLEGFIFLLRIVKIFTYYKELCLMLLKEIFIIQKQAWNKNVFV